MMAMGDGPTEAETRERVAALEAALDDRPSHEDMDAERFLSNALRGRVATLSADLDLARDRIARLETAILDFLDDPSAAAIGRLGSALEQDWDEAVRLG